MKIPIKPPSVSELWQKLGSDRALELFVTTENMDDARYLHWDDLVHRPTPQNLDHEEWWFVIKSTRQKAQRPTPFTDVAGHQFTYTLPDSILEQLHWIDSQAHGQIGAVGKLPSSEQRNRYIIRSLMEEAITSSQLEGAATTRKVALDMLRSGRAPRTHGEHMIRNNYYAMRMIGEISDRNISEEQVFSLHRTLTENTLQNPDSAGRMQTPREQRVHVYDHTGNQVLHRPPGAEELPHRLKTLIDFANGKGSEEQFIHPVLRAIILHFALAYDHPFEDGNGRTARAMFYWSMLRQGYWLMEFVSISRLIRKAPVQYGRAFLLTETDENDLTYFIIHQLDIITKSIEALHRWIAQKASEVDQLQQIIGETKGLNHRQKALLVHAIKHTTQTYTIESHQKSHDIAYGTSRSDLYRLADEGWLDKSKPGRRMEFTPGERLLGLVR